MSVRRVVIQLTSEEVEVLLRWADRATRPLYPSRERYLSEAEAELLSRLEQSRLELTPSETDE